MIKKSLFLFSFLVCFNLSLSQDSLKSVFAGIGMGTNIGGSYGIGYEHYFNKYISSSIAAGLIDTGDGIDFIDKLGFDFGIKFYPLSFVFVGINYGIIDFKRTRLIINDKTIVDEFYTKNGFSFIAGIKLNLFEPFYFIYLVGTTSDSKVNNHPIVKPTFPKHGFVLGFNF